jgi:basigin
MCTATWLALWFFLSILAEVLVLLTIIFMYKKRKKPDEALDNGDLGSASLKNSRHHTDDKDKNVHQETGT